MKQFTAKIAKNLVRIGKLHELELQSEQNRGQIQCQDILQRIRILASYPYVQVKAIFVIDKKIALRN